VKRQSKDLRILRQLADERAATIRPHEESVPTDLAEILGVQVTPVTPGRVSPDRDRFSPDPVTPDRVTVTPDPVTPDRVSTSGNRREIRRFTTPVTPDRVSPDRIGGDRHVVVVSSSSSENQENYYRPASRDPVAPDRVSPDAVAAARIRGLGQKARGVLTLLDSLRSTSDSDVTVPVGYGRIAESAGVGETHLRQRVLSRLAECGLVAVVSRAFEGTVYRLYFAPRVLALAAEKPPEVPAWIDSARWPITPETYQRLLARSGSAERAAEVLEIIAYNETHGDPARRVRSRRAVLVAYLNGQLTEIFPNDNGYEAVASRRERVKRELARRGQQLAGEALAAQRQLERTKLMASLTDEEQAQVKQEARRRVDARLPDDVVRNREPAYEEEEGRVLDERLSR
jgi:hypothetical protein